MKIFLYSFLYICEERLSPAFIDMQISLKAGDIAF
jgi:hypothetical protein